MIYFGRVSIPDPVRHPPTLWFDIYKALECIMGRFGGESAFIALDWAPREDVKRLKQTANWARHARAEVFGAFTGNDRTGGDGLEASGSTRVLTLALPGFTAREQVRSHPCFRAFPDLPVCLDRTGRSSASSSSLGAIPERGASIRASMWFQSRVRAASQSCPD